MESFSSSPEFHHYGGNYAILFRVQLTKGTAGTLERPSEIGGSGVVEGVSDARTLAVTRESLVGAYRPREMRYCIHESFLEALVLGFQLSNVLTNCGFKLKVAHHCTVSECMINRDQSLSGQMPWALPDW